MPAAYRIPKLKRRNVDIENCLEPKVRTCDSCGASPPAQPVPLEDASKLDDADGWFKAVINRAIELNGVGKYVGKMLTLQLPGVHDGKVNVIFHRLAADTLQDGEPIGPRTFVRYADGDPFNHCMENLKRVSIVEALNHPEWKVDWDSYMTPSQATFVQDYIERIADAGNLFRTTAERKKAELEERKLQQRRNAYNTTHEHLNTLLSSTADVSAMSTDARRDSIQQFQNGLRQLATLIKSLPSSPDLDAALSTQANTRLVELEQADKAARQAELEEQRCQQEESARRERMLAAQKEAELKAQKVEEKRRRQEAEERSQKDTKLKQQRAQEQRREQQQAKAEEEKKRKDAEKQERRKKFEEEKRAKEEQRLKMEQAEKKEEERRRRLAEKWKQSEQVLHQLELEEARQRVQEKMEEARQKRKEWMEQEMEEMEQEMEEANSAKSSHQDRNPQQSCHADDSPNFALTPLSCYEAWVNEEAWACETEAAAKICAEGQRSGRSADLDFHLQGRREVPRSDGKAPPEVHRIKEDYCRGAEGYLQLGRGDWILVLFWQGADTTESSGWCYGQLLGEDGSRGWLPQRILDSSSRSQQVERVPRSDGKVPPEAHRVKEDYCNTWGGYLQLCQGDWVLVLFWQGADELDASGWCHGHILGEETRCGWLPQRILDL